MDTAIILSHAKWALPCMANSGAPLCGSEASFWLGIWGSGRRDSSSTEGGCACCTPGIAWSGAQWEGAWAAIKRVWASKWNERAVLSLRRAGLPHAALQVAVLCQEVVPAPYAFVAHPTNPLPGTRP